MATERYLKIWQDSLSKSTNISILAIKTIIGKLAQTSNISMSTSYFSDTVLSLNAVSLVLKYDITIEVGNSLVTYSAGTSPPTDVRVKRGTEGILTDPKGNVIDVEYIGGGTYGEIWKGTDGRTFKRVIPQSGKTYERLARNFFCETWIQTILNMDTMHGASVGQITGLYRDSSIVRSTTPKKWNQAIFFIQMEFIPYSFGKLLDTEDKSGNPKYIDLTEQMLRGVLYKAAEILDYFEKTYSFFHRDFHSGNLMLSNNGIKIIDFGMSCITYNGITYSMPERYTVPNKVTTALGVGGPTCTSLDLLIFLMSVRDELEHTDSKDNNASNLIEYIDTLTTPAGKSYSTYKVLKNANKTLREDAIWHTAYYWMFEILDTIYMPKDKSISALDFILSVDAFIPSRLINKLTLSTYSFTGIGLSNYLPFLRPLRSALSSSSPNSNVSMAIRTLSKSGGYRKTRKHRGRKHKTRKH